MMETGDSACKDVIVRLLDKEERARLGSRSGASEVKQHKWFSKINWGLLRHTRPPVCRRNTCHVAPMCAWLMYALIRVVDV